MATKKTPKPAAKPTRAEQFSSAFTGLQDQLLSHLTGFGGWVRKHLRQRTLLVWLVPMFVIAALWFTDPDGGASTKAWMLRVLCAVLAIALSHWALRAMFDYPEADKRTLFEQARKSPEGAGMALIALAIVLVGFLMLFSGQVRAEPRDSFEITRARAYLPMLATEVDRTWRAHPDRTVLGGQISNETACPRVRSCWLPTAQLKSAREEGAGFPQLTRTYRADGSQRFDALQELVQRHPALSELTWANVYNRPDLQLRAFVLKALDDNRSFATVADPRERMVFGLVSHNRGTGGVQSERRACAMSRGCDAGRWFGNVENHCTASRVALYGNRSACDISRAYPRDIIVRAARYRGLV